MKNTLYTTIIFIGSILTTHAQEKATRDKRQEKIYFLIEQYSTAREQKDSVLLRSILTGDIDQLVSTGEWRYGISESIDGMMQSSQSRPGTRTLTIESIRFPGPDWGIVDARYEIQNEDGTIRKMWSTFIVILQHGHWKIEAIRNMKPAG